MLGGICVIGPEDLTEPSYVYREVRARANPKPKPNPNPKPNPTPTAVPLSLPRARTPEPEPPSLPLPRRSALPSRRARSRRRSAPCTHRVRLAARRRDGRWAADRRQLGARKSLTPDGR